MANLLAQFNPLRVYKDKRSRQFDLTADMDIRKTDLVFYETGKIPAIQVVFDAVPETDPVTIELLDESDNIVGDPYDMTISALDGYFRCIYLGSTEAGLAEGYYSLKITNGIDEFWTDVFCFIDDPANWEDETRTLLGIKVETSDILVGKEYRLNMTNFIPQFYLNADVLGDKQTTDQQGNKQRAITNINYGSRAFQRCFEISGNRAIWMYLSALGLLQGNGQITLTWYYETFIASDILVEDTNENTNGMYQIKLTFVDESETISMLNI